MPVFYQFSLRDSTGVQVALLAGSDGGQWHSCSYDHIENGVGRSTLTIDGRLDFIPNLTDRTILKIQRKVVREGGGAPRVIDWYTEWEGTLDFISDDTVGDVNVVKLEFASYLDFVKCRAVQYKPLTTYSEKDGNGETVIKELVNENAGPGASSVDRYVDGVVTGLSIEADTGLGNRWAGSHSGEGLLDAITKIANGTNMFFDVVSIGAALFEFRCYYLSRGVNRSAVGVDRTTGGLNQYGYAPVVFSRERGNINNPSLGHNFRDSQSSITVLGTGQDEDIIWANRMNARDVIRSPWSIREVVLRNTAEYLPDALVYLANEAIVANRVKTTLDFDVVQVDSCLYGADYSWGDIITGVHKGIEYTKRISSVGVQVTPDTEIIKPVMLEV